MRRLVPFAAMIAVLFSATANAAVVGEASPLADGDVDGWSGVSVLDGYGSLPAGEKVDTVNYYASAGRADGNHNVQPLVIKNDGVSSTIWAVGPVATPDSGGEHSIAWETDLIPAGDNYYVGIWQWNEGVNNEAGGLVPFSGNGGSGMFQMDLDGTTYSPAVGDEITSGHASGADGRAYQVNFVTSVPEPATALLAAFGLLPCLLLRRKK